MNRADRTSTLLASLLLGLIAPALLVNGVAAHPVPDFIRNPSASKARESRIYDSQIRKILAAMAAAANQKDVEGLMKYMAPDITIKLTLRVGKGSQELNLSRAEYKQYLQQGFEATERYSGKYTNLKIQIAPNGKTGTATYTLVEEAKLKGQPVTLISTSQETITFEHIKGEILATAVMGDSTIVVK
ncbi:MAG: nuclear transport factor 2 family protein [Lyngbya sp. HA4199-MV5]|jgi:ketosteroid isomerase-like protein|nr:nuclear transport factor 2 family protein [Lyngbya sp. HA4199-MV5]